MDTHTDSWRGRRACRDDGSGGGGAENFGRKFERQLCLFLFEIQSVEVPDIGYAIRNRLSREKIRVFVPWSPSYCSELYVGVVVPAMTRQVWVEKVAMQL